jgi:hypothetical protein
MASDDWASLEEQLLCVCVCAVHIVNTRLTHIPDEHCRDKLQNITVALFDTLGDGPSGFYYIYLKKLYI